jgi:TPR repeat protein
MYSRGESVPKNYTEAMKWYKKAADQGYTSAQNNLATMYADGKGVPKNFVKAYVWYSIASANGDETSKKNLDILNSDMTPQQIAQAQKEAAELWDRINKSKK